MEALLIKGATYGWGAVVGLVLYIWRKQENKIETQDRLINELVKQHTLFVTEQEAKNMIREFVDPIIQDQKEIRADVKHILAALQELKQDLAVQAAVAKAHQDSIDNHKRNL